MKPQLKLASARTPDGGEMELYQHDRDFAIKINGLELMNSRQHTSEQELARLGCAHLTGQAGARVLVGGLGMGYTLRQALDLLDADARVVVSELLPAVVDWNRKFLGVLNAHPLDDKRTALVVGDIFELLIGANKQFDAILLDADNGPSAMTDAGNQRLYRAAGIQACRRALRERGILAVWSTEPSEAFERRLAKGGFHVRRYGVKTYAGKKSKKVFIWLAVVDEMILPEG